MTSREIEPRHLVEIPLVTQNTTIETYESDDFFETFPQVRSVFGLLSLAGSKISTGSDFAYAIVDNDLKKGRPHDFNIAGLGLFDLVVQLETPISVRKPAAKLITCRLHLPEFDLELEDVFGDQDDIHDDEKQVLWTGAHNLSVRWNNLKNPEESPTHLFVPSDKDFLSRLRFSFGVIDNPAVV